MTIENHLKHAAGMAHLLGRYNIDVVQVKANASGVILLTNAELPEPLHEHVETESDSGSYIFGVWVKNQTPQH